MKERWTASGLVFAPFEVREAPTAKAIFESDPALGALDPTFREYPLSEYESLAHGAREMQLDVYAEHLAAFGFWYRHGFDGILGFEPERVDGGLWHCLRLRRALARD